MKIDEPAGLDEPWARSRPASLDEPWARTPPARAARELLLSGVFRLIIGTYSHREVVGREHLEQLETPAIFVANHCSHVDTPVLLLSLPPGRRRRTAVAAAADYFYVNRLLAHAVSLTFGTVPLERRGRGRNGEAIAHIEQLVDAGWSLVLFAEGTRSRDGRVGRMRAGAATLAAHHSVPIVPIHISGTHAAMPPGRRWMVRPAGGGRFARHTIRVSFGPPIQVGPGEDPVAAMERVRGFMRACGADTTPDVEPGALKPAAAV